MMYSKDPARWAYEPIVIGTNPFTGLRDGNDGKNPSNLALSPGYREVLDIDSAEELVDVQSYDLFATPDYDGMSIFGVNDPTRILPGGVRGKKMLLRRAFAEGCVEINRVIKMAYGNAYELQLVDAYRTAERQAAGFTRMMRELADGLGWDFEALTDVQIVELGRAADLTFAWVRVNTQNITYRTVLDDLMRDTKFLSEIRSAIDGGVLKGTLDDAVQDYITISANCGLGRATRVPLNARKNAHSGGGALDVILRGQFRGRTMPLAYTPFDFAHPISSMTFLEGDNIDAYKKLANTNEQLKRHLKMLGIKRPDDFQRSDWDELQRANRILFWAFMTAGGSFYDPGDDAEPGEWWHMQLGLHVYGPNGDVVVAEENLGGDFPNSGNTCHTLLRTPAGPKRVAVRTEPSARLYVERHFGHDV